MDYQQLAALAEAGQAGMVAFAQKLVQTPSLPGQEKAVAALVEAEMARLGYDQVWIDGVGNVIGRITGGGGPPMLFNGHMDHVDAGDPARWPHPPFGGEIHGGELWGRGAADMKGALAAMVYAGGLLKKLPAPPPGDRYVTAVVQEEVGGLGSQHLGRTLDVKRAVIGEASGNQLRRGHRGRVGLVAHFEGRSVHASMPDLGINPHFSAARFVAGLRGLKMAADEAYGASSVAPTRVWSEPASGNVTPAALHLVLDWRNIPGERPEAIVAKLEALLAESLEPGCGGRIAVSEKELTSYTGVRVSYPDVFPSFTTAADDPWLLDAWAALCAALGREVEICVWRFATDGGHLAEAGATALGFGPGDDRLVHTVEERISLDQLVEGVVGYLALSLI
ncbi:MAG: M20/M25/M40 family metallo-hydrolase [Anaerolineae bacterium]|nr:M20/M25/M40 family metallo-hydrolase [Anaerolineae bacterium]